MNRDESVFADDIQEAAGDETSPMQSTTGAMPITFSDAERESISAVYIAANTPSFLYKRLRALQEITALSKRATPQELIEHALSIDAGSLATIVDAAGAYAALVAATITDPTYVRSALEGKVVRQLRWLKQMADIASQRRAW